MIDSIQLNDPYCIFRVLYDAVDSKLAHAENGADLMDFVEFYYCDTFRINTIEIPFDRHKFLQNVINSIASSQLDRGTKIAATAQFNTLQRNIDAKFAESPFQRRINARTPTQVDTLIALDTRRLAHARKSAVVAGML